MSEYEGLWGSEVLSDVEVVLFEEAHELGVKRKQKVSIGCHKLVLACNSDYFKAQVVNWSSAVHDSQTSTQTDSSRKPRFSMAVPVGQLELGQLLLKSMYQVKPDFADLQQEMWLPLLMLADKYAVSKVITALCINFKDAYTTLDWQVVLGFYMLPEVLSNSSQCRTIRDAVTNKLHLELGDLELVWASAQKQQMLLQLPFGGLRKLLQSEVTKVTSENTAAYTVLQWARAQPTSDDGIKQQMQQLCSLLRMRHCSQLFIATVLSTDANISSCLSPYELQVAALCSSQQALNLNNDVVRKNPTWRRSPCPATFCMHQHYSGLGGQTQHHRAAIQAVCGQ